MIKFENAEMEVVRFEVEEVIATSAGDVSSEETTTKCQREDIDLGEGEDF